MLKSFENSLAWSNEPLENPVEFIAGVLMVVSIIGLACARIAGVL